MKQRFIRLLSAVLACMLLLTGIPFFAIAAVNDAAVAEGNRVWFEDFEDASVMSDVFSKYPAAGLKLSTATTDSQNKVGELALQGIAPRAYYLVSYSAKKYVELKTYTLSEDGTSMTGVSATLNGVTYTNASGVINDKAYSSVIKDESGASVSGIYICTGELTDASWGVSNTAKANYFKNAAVANADVENFVVEMKIYLPEGAQAQKNITTQISGTKVSDGSAVHLALFWLTPNGKTATLRKTDRQSYVDGADATLTLGAWHRITMVISKETSEIEYYVDGEYAYAAKNTSTGTMAEVNAPINVTANSLLIQINRLHYDTATLQKYLQFDDVAIYSSTDGLGLTKNTPVWREDFEGLSSVGDGFYTAAANLPAGLTLATSPTDPTDHVAQLALKGMAPYDYYLVNYKDKKFGPLSGYSVTEENGKLTLTGGTATVNGTKYTGVQGTVNTATYSSLAKDSSGANISGLYICTGELTDTYCIVSNTAKPLTFANPAVTLADAEVIALELSLYLPAGARADKTINSHISGTKVEGGTEVSVALFALTPNGKTAKLGTTDKSTYVRGGAVTLALGSWYRLSFVIDPQTSQVDVFVDGRYVYTVKNSNSGKLAEIAAPINIKANTWTYQFNRLSLPQNLAEYFQVDDAAIYTSLDGLGLYMGEDFDAYSASIGSTPELGIKPNAGATYAQDPLDSQNVTVKVPFNARESNVEILMRMSGNCPVDKGYYTVTRNAETGAVEVTDKTVTLEADGTYTIVDGENTYTGLVLGTMQDYWSYWGGDDSINQSWRLHHYDVDASIHKKTVFSASYYISEDACGRFVSELYNYNTNGEAATWLYLYSVDAAKGSITIGQNTVEGVTLIKGAWNTVALEVDLETGDSALYVNGAHVGTDNLGAQMLSFDAANWIFCKIPRRVSAYYGSFAGYVLVDNVQMHHEGVSALHLDPEALMYVDVKGTPVFEDTLYLPYGTEYEPVYFDKANYEGMLSTEAKNSIRLSVPTGLRFATSVDKARLDELFALADKGLVERVEFGTLIAPTSYIASDFTMSAFEAEGKKYLEVAATRDVYFPYDNDESTTHFVGSIVNFYEHNIPRSFAGRGFVTVTLKNGQRIEIYSAHTQSATVVDVAQKALASTHAWSDSEREILELFANGEQPPVSERVQMAREISGLNVLAIGDSHFNGSDTQWLTLISNETGWNLTNLGKSGWTVAYNPKAYPEGATVRRSMYDYLFNRADYVYGSTSSNYYTCGDTSGKTPEDVDLIIFEGGWNDFGWNIPLGTTDSTDYGTLQGARNLMIQKLLTDYPNAKIMLLTEWHRDDTRASDGASRLEFVSDSLKALYAEKYASNDRIVLIDAGDPAVSGVDMTDASWYPTYAPDRTHLNEEGMKLFAENILPYLWSAYTGKALD